MSHRVLLVRIPSRPCNLMRHREVAVLIRHVAGFLQSTSYYNMIQRYSITTQLSLSLLLHMDSSPKVSSLYGPGAFAGWLCTTASVFISWTCNRHSEAHDTIGNDLIAALTIPTVATIHHLVELSKSGTENAESTTATLDTTLCVVLWFVSIGQLLSLLATIHGRLKRSVCISIPSVICIAALFAQPTQHDPLRKIPSMWLLCLAVSVLPLLVFGSITVSAAIRFVKNQSRGAPASPLIETEGRTDLYYEGAVKTAIVLRRLFLAVFYILTVIAVSAVGDRLPKMEDGSSNIGSILAEDALPRNGTSITELDQAIAISAGVLTLAISIFEAIFYRDAPLRRSTKDRGRVARAFLSRVYLLKRRNQHRGRICRR